MMPIGTNILGADPEQLEATARRLRIAADVHTRAEQEIGYRLSQTDWTGENAERFRRQYHTRIGPCLTSAATFLASLHLELERQALDQRLASGQLRFDIPPNIPIPPIFPWPPGRPGVADETNTIDLLEVLKTIAGPLVNIPWEVANNILAVESAIGFSHYMIRHISGLRNLPFWRFTPYVVDKLDDLGLAKILGSTAGKVFAGVGGIIGAVSLPGDIEDLRRSGEALSKAAETYGIGDEFWEASAQFAYSFGDIPIDLGGIVLAGSLVAGPAAPIVAAVGVGLLAGGVAVKGIGFAIDHLREPIIEPLVGAIQDLHELGIQFTADVAGAVVDVAGDVAEGIVDVAGDVADFAGDVADGVVDFAEGAVKAGANAIKSGLNALKFW